MRETVVRMLDPVADDHGITWSGTLRPPGDDEAITTFRFGSPTGAAPAPSARPFLLAFLPFAMRIGAPVRVVGPIDETTLTNLMEWQEAMACWHPGDLHVVPLVADEGTTPAVAAPSAGPAPRGAVAAFSGGVDSCFTAVRHRPGAGGVDGVATFRRAELRAGLLVHGFDIPRDDVDTFLSCRDRAAHILDGLGIDLLWLQTDVRSLEARFPVDWETTSHGIWLASALACVEGFFDVALIPSTFTYRLIKLPWASNPITDPLLAGDRVPYWHDGAAFHKAAKVRALVGHPSVEAGVRVCWEGGRLDRNCGHCWKCAVTQACFWINGVEAPACFDDRITVADLAATPLRNPELWPIAEQIRQSAVEAGRTDIAEALATMLGS